MQKWPRDNQDALIAFYGNPGAPSMSANLVKVIPPFKMTYDGKALSHLMFHKLAAPALQRALNTVWEYYGRDQKKIDALGISKTAGTYNPRFIRGSTSKWSNHAYGAAIDINAEQNGFNVAGNIPIPMIAAFKAEGARWGGDYSGRKDPMHFEFCASGEPERTFEEWLKVYGAPSSSKPVPTPAPAPLPNKDTYDEALRRLLVHEGGYGNDPADPGGPTNFGITIFDYRKYINASGTAADVRMMNLAQAKAIYKSKYWNAMRCDELPTGVNYAVFDYGVNSGIGRAPKVLQQVIGVAVDGKIGDATLKAVRARDPKAVVNAICDERMRFLKGLPIWPRFGTGWSRRVSEVRVASLAMIARGAAQAAPAGPPVAVAPTPGKAQVPEPKAAKEAIRTGAPGGALLAGAGFWGWVSAHPKTSILIVVVIAAGIAYGLYALKQWHRSKQETPMPSTPVVPESAA